MRLSGTKLSGTKLSGTKLSETLEAEAMSDALNQLLAKQEILEVVVRYARAIDRLDETLLRSLFHPESTHNHFYQGPSSAPERAASEDDPGDFVRYAIAVLSTHARTHHQLGNTLIELTGETEAHVETYFTAFHKMRGAGDPLAGPDAFDTEMDFFVGGRYLDKFELRDGRWKIIHRTGMTDWMRLDPPSARGMSGMDPSVVGQRFPDDFIYQLPSV
ncbi:MAG: nuclear transport factor 2 family protein [Luminiphilus sp.]|nr:nuclear transport factor 2 family protein [Luminiphilus sp.]